MDGVRRGTLGAVAVAAPQGASALAYAAVWIAPTSFPSDFARILMLGMVVEFLLIHSFPFLFVVGAGERHEVGRWRRSLAVAAIGMFYLTFAAALAKVFASSAPLWTFGWLIASRVATIWIGSHSRVSEIDGQIGGWGRSAALYIGGLIATAIVPLPRLGLTPEAVTALALPGSGTWIEAPQKLFAFGLIYFGAAAYFAARTAARSERS